MKNIAKCLLCGSTIQSFHSSDYVLCECGEIAVDGGDAMRCFARDWKHFQRIDEKGHPFVPTIAKEGESEKSDERSHITSKDDLMAVIDEMIKSYERLPSQALSSPATAADLLSILFLVKSICRF